MGERKVLNKYFPPDFDPSKLPRHRGGKGAMGIRMMLPFNMCCLSCGHYMYMGKKFNSRKEVAKGMDYLGIRRLRFTVKCEVCNADITFLTDPKNQDYECEKGATRNYSAWQEQRKEKTTKLRELEKQNDAEVEEVNPLQQLETETREQLVEQESLEKLQKLETLTRLKSKVDINSLLQRKRAKKHKLMVSQDEVAIRDFKILQGKRQDEKLNITAPNPSGSASVHSESLKITRKKRHKTNLAMGYES